MSFVAGVLGPARRALPVAAKSRAEGVIADAWSDAALDRVAVVGAQTIRRPSVMTPLDAVHLGRAIR